MTTQDKVETEDGALASEDFRRDLRLYGRAKDTMLGFSQGVYPEYNMVIDWADACGDIAFKTQQSAHDIAWAAFQKCIKAIELEKVGLPRDKVNSILDEAVQNEIENFINKHSGNKNTKKGRPPRPSIFEQNSSLKGFPA
ncbi:hypothetical protein HK16_18390 [Acetobacter senegalensis]|uniref:Uncharacterized protein n=2 Tax=Acetobacter TaxID=434 RepID=A0A252EG67_9PROT|nr:MULTISPECIES: hypothetical protein [Acetobacter]ATJ90706.1 hypothetical protein CIW82_08410 [Acetobacter tropicalis]OUL65203.1 hypothetical protein HK16_18390 [Acetobacter senegalensis]